jgi:hypothetical protein
MKCTLTYHDRRFGVGVKAFGKKGDGPAVRCLTFDRRLLMHATNPISAIVYEISSARTGISFQRISTICLEKRFGGTRRHAGIHQTLCGILKTMEIDEAMKFVYPRAAVHSRRLSYGSIVTPYEYLGGVGIDMLVLAQSLLCVVGSPIAMTQVVADMAEDGVHIYVEKLMSDLLRSLREDQSLDDESSEAPFFVSGTPWCQSFITSSDSLFEISPEEWSGTTRCSSNRDISRPFPRS